MQLFAFAVKDAEKCPCIFKALKGGFKPFKYKVSRIKQTALKTARKWLLEPYSDVSRLLYRHSHSKPVKVDFCLGLILMDRRGSFTTYYHDFTTQRKFQTYKMGAKGVCLRLDEDFSRYEKP